MRPTKESVRKEGQGRVAVQYCLQHALTQWLYPPSSTKIRLPKCGSQQMSLSPRLPLLRSCDCCLPSLPPLYHFSISYLPGLGGRTPWGVGLVSPSILLPYRSAVPPAPGPSHSHWCAHAQPRITGMILWECSENTASCPRLVARGAHRLLLQPGSHFALSGDGLAGLGLGL